MEKLQKIFLTIGIILLVLIPIWMFAVVPELEKMPVDYAVHLIHLGEDKVVEETIKGTPGTIGEGIVSEGRTFGIDIDFDAKKKEKVKCGPGEKKDDNGNCVPRRVDEEVTVEKKKSGMKKVCTNWEWVEKGSGMGAKRKDAGPRPTETITKTKSVRNV